VRQLVDDGPGDGESAEARVEDADRGVHPRGRPVLLHDEKAKGWLCHTLEDATEITSRLT
jgi:hypothetical protein